jgi:quercetin dioxygenase-like cupin family protein
MATETLKAVKKNLGSPDASKEIDHGKVELATLADTTVARITLEPGWTWSEHVRPLVKTESCEMRHLQYVISGRMRLALDDGSELEIGPGDFAEIPAGHKAFVVGNEPFVCIELSRDMKEFVEDGSSR